MFDIVYLGRRCVGFIRRYPRTWTVIGLLITFGIGIWVGRVVKFERVPEYVQSYTDPVKTDETKQVFPGVVHRQILDDGVLTNILSVSPDAVDIRPYSAMGAAIGTEDLLSIARRNRAPIAINGGFYEMSGTFRGESVGALKINGEWISEPEQGRGVVAFKTVDGKIETSIDRIALQHRILLPNDTPIEIDGINRGRQRNELLLYRPNFHFVTLTMPEGVEVIVRDNIVTDIRDGQGSTPIPKDGYILSATGRKRGVLLEHIHIGDAVRIQEKVIPEKVGESKFWEDFTHIIGGGPLLLRNGVVSTRDAYEREGFDSAFHSFWHPRTAIGKKADGTLFFVTISAAKPGVRRGVMLHKLARLFVEWGATDAVNLDGGLSTMMVIRNEVVSYKLTRPDKSGVEEKQKMSAKEKQTAENRKADEQRKQIAENKKSDEQRKQTDKIEEDATPDDKTVKGATSDDKTAEKKTPEPVNIIKETKVDAADEKPAEKASTQRSARTGRGNRRVRPMPRFQGRAISDAILIFPKSSAKKRTGNAK